MIYWNIIVVVIIAILIMLILTMIEYAKSRRFPSIAFDSIYKDLELPIITLNNNGREFNFLVDTGANMSIFNSRYIDDLKYDPIPNAQGTMYGVDGSIRTIEYIQIILSKNKDQFLDVFQLTDLDSAFGRIMRDYGIPIHGVLGGSFLDKYKCIIEYNNYCIKYKKNDLFSHKN